MHLNSSGEARCSSLYAGSHGVLFALVMAAVLPPVRFLKSASKRVWLGVLNPPQANWNSVRCQPTSPILTSFFSLPKTICGQFSQSPKITRRCQ